jgi:transcriptional regulator with XRE-family HTH domain/ribosomal protein S18 acetylase RimI-like enzyme
MGEGKTTFSDQLIKCRQERDWSRRKLARKLRAVGGRGQLPFIIRRFLPEQWLIDDWDHSWADIAELRYGLIPLTEKLVEQWEHDKEYPSRLHMSWLCQLFGVSEKLLGIDSDYEEAFYPPLPIRVADDLFEVISQGPLRGHFPRLLGMEQAGFFQGTGLRPELSIVVLIDERLAASRYLTNFLRRKDYFPVEHPTVTEEGWVTWKEGWETTDPSERMLFNSLLGNLTAEWWTWRTPSTRIPGDFRHPPIGLYGLDRSLLAAGDDRFVDPRLFHTVRAFRGVPEAGAVIQSELAKLPNGMERAEEYFEAIAVKGWKFRDRLTELGARLPEVVRRSIEVVRRVIWLPSSVRSPAKSGHRSVPMEILQIVNRALGSGKSPIPRALFALSRDFIGVILKATPWGRHLWDAFLVSRQYRQAVWSRLMELPKSHIPVEPGARQQSVMIAELYGIRGLGLLSPTSPEEWRVLSEDEQSRIQEEYVVDIIQSPTDVFAATLLPFQGQKFGLPISFTISHYQDERDKEDVIARLGQVLPQLYGPSSEMWLEDKAIVDLREGRRHCWIGRADGRLVAILIETPKGLGALKLSNIWVDPRYRRMHIGMSMLETARGGWLEKDIKQVHVTVNAESDVTVSALKAAGFSVEIAEPERYLPGATELGLVWRPQHAIAITLSKGFPPEQHLI